MASVDLVMWAKNGGKNLAPVLNRINHVVPNEAVNHKILVDDRSVDNTARIAESFGWHVISNEGKGISDGANTALKHVETEYFCSFEQDVFLSNLWWNRISPLILGKAGVAAACGLRFLPRNNLYYSVEPYTLASLPAKSLGGYGKTLDNTIWKTDILRSVGGFPQFKYSGHDVYLIRLYDFLGYKWLVDDNVQSLHLHSGLMNELKHYYFYGRGLSELYKRLSPFCNVYRNQDLTYFFVRLVKSPASALRMAKKMHDARLLVAYPSIRFSWFMGYLKGRPQEKNKSSAPRARSPRRGLSIATPSIADGSDQTSLDMPTISQQGQWY